MKIKPFGAREIQYFELEIFPFYSYVYYLIRSFVTSTRAFNLPTRAFNLATCAFSLLTRGFELVTRNSQLVFYFSTENKMCLMLILCFIAS